MKEDAENMSRDLQKNAIERAKDLLGIKEDIESPELYKKLREYRNNIHPDRFQEEEQKKLAEEKFKEAQTLITEVFTYIQQEELSATPTDLINYKPFYDNVYFQENLDQSKQRIESLEHEVKSLREQNKILTEKLEEKVSRELLDEIKEIENHYKVSYENIKPIGAIILLTSLIAIMSKIEEVSNIIRKYSPFSDHTLNIGIFVVFSFLLLFLFKQLAESRLFSFVVNKYCSSRYTSNFMKYLSDRYDCEADDVKTFNEKDAYDFIAGNNSFLKRSLSFLGVRLLHSDTLDNIKKCFINNLLHKKLIEVAEAKNLDRQFKILRPSTRRRYPWNDD